MKMFSDSRGTWHRLNAWGAFVDLNYIKTLGDGIRRCGPSMVRIWTNCRASLPLQGL